MARLKIGSRGSALALAQSLLVKSLLEKLAPDLQVDIEIIKTTGDRLSESSAPPAENPPGKGVFIKELEEALLDKRVDLAVHSLKDVPTELPPGFVLAAVLEREDPRDCLISRFGEQMLELPKRSLIGTGSPRRQAQIRAAHKGVRVQDMRGNLDTRLKKVADGDVDAIVVAHAGVKRLGRQDEVSEVLDFKLMLPAPGQGFIAIEVRADDAETRKWVAALNHAPSARAAEAERSFLAGLGGGCRVPIAAYAREEEGKMVLDGLVISPDGERKVHGSEKSPLSDPEAAGKNLAARLLQEGAGRIFAGDSFR